MACEFCAGSGAQMLWHGPRYRVVAVAEAGYPGFCRVIWNAHVREMTDLTEEERARFLQGVFAVETVLRRLMSPDKINLACLGNLTPHLHWHVIPRYADDPHFPLPIWATAQRPPARTAAPALWATIARELAASLDC